MSLEFLVYGAALWTGFVYFVEMLLFYRTFTTGRHIKHSGRIPGNYRPYASLIVPCKGTDYELEENIKAILGQRYGRHEVIFVVDSYRDPAYRVVKKFRKKNVRIIKAQKIKTCSGKIAAQLAGIRAAKGEVLAFADSDIRPSDKWLAYLISPLNKKGTGITTGYRWYFSPKNRFSSCLRSAWNTIGFGMMLSRNIFVWGGSFAIKRDLFEKLGIAEKLKTEISDDAVFTNEIKKSGLKILFVPECIVGSFDDSDLRATIKWICLQTTFVCHYMKKAVYAGVIAYGFHFLVLASAITLLFAAVFLNNFFVAVAGVLLLITRSFGAMRGYWRYRKFSRAIKGFEKYFRLNKTKHVAACMLVPYISLYAILKARKAEYIMWRGRKYRLK